VFTLLLLAACTDDPAPPPWGPPDVAGPWAPGVTTFTTTGREGEELTVEVWYPAAVSEDAEPDRYLELPMAGTAFRDATPASDGPFPLLAFSHGSQGIRYQSITLTEHWASHGFVVVAPDHPGNNLLDPESLDWTLVADDRPGQVVSAVDALLDRVADPEDRLADLVEGETYGMTGHSFGAWTTLVVAGGVVDHAAMMAFCELEPEYEFCRIGDEPLSVAGAPDPRAVLALPMAPGGWYAFLEDGLESVGPAQVWGGTLDEHTPLEPEVRPTYEALDAPKELQVLEGAGHFVFSDICLVGPFISDECDGEEAGYLDMAVGQDISRTVTTSWLRRSLIDDSRDQDWWDLELEEWPELETWREE